MDKLYYWTVMLSKNFWEVTSMGRRTLDPNYTPVLKEHLVRLHSMYLCKKKSNLASFSTKYNFVLTWNKHSFCYKTIKVSSSIHKFWTHVLITFLHAISEVFFSIVCKLFFSPFSVIVVVIPVFPVLASWSQSVALPWLLAPFGYGKRRT